MDELKARLLAIMEERFPRREPYEQRNPNMRGDDPNVDRRDDERSAIDDFIDILMEDDAWLKPVKAAAWEEGKYAQQGVDPGHGWTEGLAFAENPYEED